MSAGDSHETVIVKHEEEREYRAMDGYEPPLDGSDGQARKD